MVNNNQNLLLGLVNNDEEIIKEIYQLTFFKVDDFVIKNQGSKEDAEDIFHKALMQLVARYHVKPFEIESSFVGYLFTVCKNLWRRELNNQKNRVTEPNYLTLVSEERDIALASLEQERFELLQEKIKQLSKNCQMIIGLIFKGTSYKEIVAKKNYSSESVVRQRVFKCKKRLIELVKSDHRFISLRNL